MRDRIKTALTREVTMPPWAIAVDFFWRMLVLAGAVLVAVLWWQAATRDEEADRNARIQACTTEYAATYSAWDAEGQRLFGELISGAAVDRPLDPDALAAYGRAVENTAEMSRLRIGLARFARLSVLDGNEFQCPPLPGRLTVEPIEVR